MVRNRKTQDLVERLIDGFEDNHPIYRKLVRLALDNRGPAAHLRDPIYAEMDRRARYMIRQAEDLGDETLAAELKAIWT